MPTVLIVDGDPHARELSRVFLTSAGNAVTFAGDGADALAHVAEAPPDVIFTEIMIRKVDGLALCKRLKGNPATQHIKVIVFSFLAATVRAQEAGADGFLKKPLTERKLVDAVTSALERCVAGARPIITQ